MDVKEDERNVNNMIIEIEATTQAKAQKMLKDVENMFQDTYRQLTATVIKLSVSYIHKRSENTFYLWLYTSKPREPDPGHTPHITFLSKSSCIHILVLHSVF